MGDLWLCLRFTQLPLDILRSGTGDIAPLVVVERQRIAFACHKARAAGIDVNMSLSTALALCRDLRSVSRNRDSEASALRALAHWCYKFTPCVSLRAAQPNKTGQTADNDSILLEIGRCLRLFHGLEPLLQKISAGLRRQGYQVTASLGHTPQAAWLLGQDDQLNVLSKAAGLKPEGRSELLEADFFLQRLRQISLTKLPIDDKQRQRLQNIGLQTLGELLVLPRASLARRYSQALAQQLDRICGTVPDLQLYVHPGQRFFAERHYLSGLTSIDMLLHPLQELLRELHEFLTAGQMQCQGFNWRFFHFDKSDSQLPIELSEPQNQLSNFIRLTQLKLHDFRIPAPIETVQLHSDALLSSRARSRALFSELGLQSRADRLQLIDTLRARLDEESLYQLASINEHLPEYRQARTAAGNEIPDSTDTLCDGDEPPLPLWLLPRPLQLRQDPSLDIISGARHIDSHWWRQHQQRSYFIARDKQGCHWIYYDARLRRWFVHGHYG